MSNSAVIPLPPRPHRDVIPCHERQHQGRSSRRKYQFFTRRAGRTAAWN